MGRKNTKNTIQLGMELSQELVHAVRSFARSREETLREVVELALRRHLANPPPKPEPPPIIPLPPFPPVAAVEPAKPASGRKPSPRKGGK